MKKTTRSESASPNARAKKKMVGRFKSKKMILNQKFKSLKCSEMVEDAVRKTVALNSLLCAKDRTLMKILQRKCREIRKSNKQLSR